jgi:hypothetical protein
VLKGDEYCPDKDACIILDEIVNCPEVPHCFTFETTSLCRYDIDAKTNDLICISDKSERFRDFKAMHKNQLKDVKDYIIKLIENCKRW